MSEKKRKGDGEEGFFNATEPQNSFDYVSMYGTYNIQPTAERGNEYPAIAQGISKEEKKERQRARDEWKKEQAIKHESGGKPECDPAKGNDGSMLNLPNDRK